MAESQSVGEHYLDDVRKAFRAYKKLAEKALAQVSDEALFRIPDEESNSIAINMKHIAGNMLSRWTDFLVSDGEKPNRDRDMEFVVLPGTPRAELMAYWEKGWQAVFDAVDPLTADDLMHVVTIRGQEHTVVQAINRQMMHYAYHIGQIIFLGKHYRSGNWTSLSVPRNKSAEFNAYLDQKIGATKESALEGLESYLAQEQGQKREGKG